MDDTFLPRFGCIADPASRQHRVGRPSARQTDWQRSRSVDPVRPRRNNAYPIHTYPNLRPELGHRRIRLLQITGFDLESCEVYGYLEVTSLDARPDFSTLSYTWETAVSRYQDYRGQSLPLVPSMRLLLHAKEPLDRCRVGDDQIEGGDRVLHLRRDELSEIPIKSNLGDFFYTYLRRWQNTAGPDDTFPKLWIDAVCIDQGDVSEKTSQIDLMGSIYASAKETIIWLGFEEKDVDVLNFIHSKVYPALTALMARHSEPAFNYLFGKDPRDPAFWSEEMGLQPMEGMSWLDCWYMYMRFFQTRHWFHRAWVIQEASLAEDPQWYVGRSFERIDSEAFMTMSNLLATVGWNDILVNSLSQHFLEQYETLPLPRDLGVGDMLHLRYFMRAKLEDDWSDDTVGRTRLELFWHAMVGIRRRRCERPEDKVYATFGIVRAYLPKDNPSAQEIFSAASHLTVPQLYERTAGYVLCKMSALWMLSVVEARTYRHTSGLANWCPDFRASGWGFPVGSILDDFDTSASLARGNLPQHVPTVEGSELTLFGARLSTVSHVVPAGTLGKHLLSYLNLLAALPAQYPLVPSMGRIETLCHTLCFSSFYAAPAAKHPTLAADFRGWVLQRLAEMFRAADADYNELLQERITSVLQPLGATPWLPTAADVLACVKNGVTPVPDHPFENRHLLKERVNVRVVFATDDGALGVARSGAEPGDELYILDRGTAAYLLRRTGRTRVEDKTTGKVVDDAEGETDTQTETVSVQKKWYYGDCYVPGIMYGELCTDEFKEGMEKVILV